MCKTEILLYAQDYSWRLPLALMLSGNTALAKLGMTDTGFRAACLAFSGR
jgi:hypothetical protein